MSTLPAEPWPEDDRPQPARLPLFPVPHHSGGYTLQDWMDLPEINGEKVELIDGVMW